jgi:hypothetical protein
LALERATKRLPTFSAAVSRQFFISRVKVAVLPPGTPCPRRESSPFSNGLPRGFFFDPGLVMVLHD